MNTASNYKYENILVVVDPTKKEQPALERALASAGLDLTPHVHIFFGIDLTCTVDSPDNPSLYKSAEELLALTQPFIDKDISYSAEVSWASDWQAAILHSAQVHQSDMIIIPDYDEHEEHHGGLTNLRHRLSDTKWALLRNAICPVFFVRPNASRKRVTVLAAVKTQTVASQYDTLNEKIIERGKWVASLSNADFHIVNAYADSQSNPDRGQLRRIADMDSSKVHVKLGPPEQVIADVASEINADVVVIGTLARKGILAAMRGNTSEKVLDKLTQDVLTINSPHE